MFRGLLDLINVLMAWGFAYVISFMVLIVAITYITKQNPTPIIQERITIKVIEPKPITIEEDVCNRIDGCPIVDNVRVGCEVM